MSDLALRDDNSPAERVWTVEELRENLLSGVRALVRQASGIKDQGEFELLYGRPLRELRLVVDHLVILSQNKNKD